VGLPACEGACLRGGCRSGRMEGRSALLHRSSRTRQPVRCHRKATLAGGFPRVNPAEHRSAAMWCRRPACKPPIGRQDACPTPCGSTSLIQKSIAHLSGVIVSRPRSPRRLLLSEGRGRPERRPSLHRSGRFPRRRNPPYGGLVATPAARRLPRERGEQTRGAARGVSLCLLGEGMDLRTASRRGRFP